MATLSASENLTIVKHLATKCALVSEAGYIIPAPVYFAGKEDFQAQISSIAMNTQRLIETAEIAFCSISFLRFKDLDTEASDSNFFFGLYLFRQYGLERMDESNAPDDFLKTMLRRYHSFIAALLGLRAEFAGEKMIIGLDPDRFAEAETGSLTQDDNISEGNDECRYIPGVVGFSAELTVPLSLTMLEC